MTPIRNYFLELVCSLAYTYLGYGIVLIFLSSWELFCGLWSVRCRYRTQTCRKLPFITAFNEEDVVDEKMENSLELDYPADKLHIVWVTDGSDDGTNEDCRRAGRGERITFPTARRKTAANDTWNDVGGHSARCFTDANTMVNREAIREIVLAFQDPKVGCVVGETDCRADQKTGGCRWWRYYWKWINPESTLMHGSTRLWSSRRTVCRVTNCSKRWSLEAAQPILFSFTRSQMKGYTIAIVQMLMPSKVVRDGAEEAGASAHRCGRIAAHLAASSVAELSDTGLASIYVALVLVMVYYSVPVVCAFSRWIRDWRYGGGSTIFYGGCLPCRFLRIGILGYYLSTKQIKTSCSLSPTTFIYECQCAGKASADIWRRKRKRSQKRAEK